MPEQIVARLEPNTFDLGIALAAGAFATYAKVNPGAVSSMAGTAIAVALNGAVQPLAPSLGYRHPKNNPWRLWLVIGLT